MNIEFENGFITSFPNQICTFEHKGKKLHCNVDRMIEEYKKKKPAMLKVDDNTYEILDGNHRLYRAFSEGKEKIEA